MILKHSNGVKRIKFEPADWNSGRASAIIDVLKSFPKGSKRYNPSTKLWSVLLDKVSHEDMCNFNKVASAEYSIKEAEEYDVKEFLSQFD